MTEASAGTGSPSRTALPAGPVWRAGLLAALAATVVNASSGSCSSRSSTPASRSRPSPAAPS